MGQLSSRWVSFCPKTLPYRKLIFLFAGRPHITIDFLAIHARPAAGGSSFIWMDRRLFARATGDSCLILVTEELPTNRHDSKTLLGFICLSIESRLTACANNDREALGQLSASKGDWLSTGTCNPSIFPQHQNQRG